MVRTRGGHHSELPSVMDRCTHHARPDVDRGEFKVSLVCYCSARRCLPVPVVEADD